MNEETRELPPSDPRGESTLAADAPAQQHETASERVAIGPYRLLQRLGEGGMGEVWLAEQSAPLERRVALKLIKLGMNSKEVVARFESERQALAMMDHPSIARVYDAGTSEEGRPYFVMEHVQGEPITRHCDRARASTRARIELMIEVCSAVQHAHQKAIIHRDLKPSNILVSLGETGARPKVIDFGIAKAIGRQLTERTMFTEVGQMIGTPEYMSPEQAEMSAQNVDTRTDVYSLGVVLYQLLVGALPFDARELRSASFDEIRRRIREEDPPRPSTRISSLGQASALSARNRGTEVPALARELRGDLDWITMKALEKDRTRRYDTPAELAADLRRFLDDEPVLARPPSATYRARKFVRRHRAGVSFAALLLGALLALVVSMSVQAERIARERDRANHEAQVANAALDFLTDLFRISDPSEARGNEVTAREVLDKGSTEIEAAFADQPEIQARLMGTIGNVYESLGLYSAAEAPLRTALELRRRELGDAHPDTASALEDLGNLQFSRGNYDAAQEHYREALAIHRRLHTGDHVDLAWSLSKLGNALSAIGDYAAAEPLFREALEMGRRLPGLDAADVSGLVTNMANLFADVGDVDAAEPLYREALEMDRRLHGGDHPQVAFSLDNLALVLHDKGDYAAAEPLYREALAMLRRVYGAEHPELAQTLGNVASFLLDKGDYEESAAMTREALELDGKFLGSDHPRVADSLLLLAELANLEGQNQEAERLAQEALTIYRRRLPAEHPKTIGAEGVLGAILDHLGRREEAEPLLLKGIESMRQGEVRRAEWLRAVRRLVALYEGWNRPAEAARYRALADPPRPP